MGAAALVHGLQETALGQQLCCGHLPRWSMRGASLGLHPSSPTLLLLGRPVSNILLFSDPLEPSHGHVVA